MKRTFISLIYIFFALYSIAQNKNQLLNIEEFQKAKTAIVLDSDYLFDLPEGKEGKLDQLFFELVKKTWPNKTFTFLAYDEKYKLDPNTFYVSCKNFGATKGAYSMIKETGDVIVKGRQFDLKYIAVFKGSGQPLEKTFKFNYLKYSAGYIEAPHYDDFYYGSNLKEYHYWKKKYPRYAKDTDQEFTEKRDFFINSFEKRYAIALKNIKEQIDAKKTRTDFDEQFRSKEYKTVLKQSTLVIPKRLMDEDLSESKLKEVYPYKIKVVTNEEWLNILNAQESDFLLLDVSEFLWSDKRTTLFIRNGVTDKLYYTSMQSGSSSQFRITEKFLKKILD